MNEKSRITKISSYDTDDIFSKAYCRWVYPICHDTRRKKLDLNDVYKCPKDDEAHVVVQQLEKNWNNEISKNNPSFVRALIKSFATSFITPFLLFALMECILKTIQSILLGYVILNFSDFKSDNFGLLCAAAAGICICTLITVAVNHPAYVAAMRISMHIKIAWSSLIYNKCLKLSRSSISTVSIGHIINLMTNDVRRFDEFCIVISYFLFFPIQLICFISVSWTYIGPACVWNVIGLVLFVPLMGFMGKKITKFTNQIAPLTDYRVSLMNEIVRGIRIIKLYAWEKHFEKLVNDARSNEMNRISKSLYLKALSLSLSFVSSRIVMFFSFVAYVLIGGELSSAAIFVNIALFERLRYTITWMLPQAVSGAAEILVSCKRIQKFLLMEEIKPIEVKQKIAPNGVIIKNLNANTNQITSTKMQASNFSLKKISIVAKPNDLLAVIGPIGSGKSLFLLSLLNELDFINADEISINGNISYVSQESWCFNATVRQNILFDRSFDEIKYRKILHICALESDIRQLPNGDLTLVGERGITLSGGQKARINLARSLYQDSDIYLFDDILSSVDVSVAKHIFEKCILEYLNDKTVILVTHQLQFLQKASKIMYLDDGECKALGNFEELTNSGIDFVSILKKKDIKSDNESKDEEKEIKSKKFDKSYYEWNKDSKIKLQETNNDYEEKIVENHNIRGRIYWEYIKAGSGPILFSSILLSTIASQFLYHFSDYWLSTWESDNKSTNNQPKSKFFNITIYAIISISLFIAGLIRSVTFFMLCLKSSQEFHNRIFAKLVRAPMATFDYNPIGRILNRFTRDIGILDDALPMAAFDLNLAIVQLCGTLIVVMTVNPTMILHAIAFAWALTKIRNIYAKPLRDIKQLESITRSPIYSHFSITIDGLTTIRASKSTENVRQQFYALLNDHTALWFLQFSSSRSLGIILDVICFLYTCIVVLTLIIFRESVSEINAGFALSSVVTLTGMAQWGVKRTTDVESLMTSVERLLQYCDLPTEVQTDSVRIKPKVKWPKTGQIIMKSLSMTYPNTSKSVLNNINLTINGGEKIGIIGRTGAGKSSLIAALFRLCESEGTILIDDIDFRDVNLYDLRESISIIPQDPVTFSGTLRRNLDPFDEHTDENLWQTLEDVQLKDTVLLLPQQLKTIVSENGFNFSVGQKQLICLARAILRHNKILVLDEATANVDHQTDALIQSTIRNKFASCTVITIAHRIDTVIDSDRIMVLNSGKIMEIGVPKLLLKDENSYFHQLVQQTGKSTSVYLRERAEESFNTIIEKKNERDNDIRQRFIM